MGACDFRCTAKGKTAKEAFNDAQSDARYEFGHGGYTGTIAEKSSFTMIEVPASFSSGYGDKTPEQIAYRYADHLIQEDDPRISDKWGPAGCIALADGEYLFFGWASS